jgi:hypothetical protein
MAAPARSFFHDEFQQRRIALAVAENRTIEDSLELPEYRIAVGISLRGPRLG